MSTSTARASNRLAPGRRRLTPDDTFHRIDPTLHEEPTLHTTTSGMSDTADRLSDFARQVIAQEGDADEHEVDDELFHPADLGDITTAVLTGTMNGSGNSNGSEAERAGDSSNIDDLATTSRGGATGNADGNLGTAQRSRSQTLHETEEAHDDEEDELDTSSSGPALGRGRKRQKKSTQPVGPGQTRDPVQMKKDSHKEVERRRREVINDGICEIQRLLPNLSAKAGKGSILRTAAEYIEELQSQVGAGGQNMVSGGNQRLAMENDRLEREIAAVTAQLADEHTRSLTLEASWRDAEDRAAQNQFELERVKAELENAKMQLLEKRR